MAAVALQLCRKVSAQSHQTAQAAVNEDMQSSQVDIYST